MRLVDKPLTDEDLDDFANRGDYRMNSDDVQRLVAEVRRLREAKARLEDEVLRFRFAGKWP